MIDHFSMATNEGQTRSPSHVRPDYAKYNFANIPGSVLHLLGVPAANRLPAGALAVQAPVQKVVFLFIDAFGWNLYERLANSAGLLRRVRSEGVVAQLTSQFPSTTTAHVTTMHTNWPVGRHGVFEWHYYEPLVDAVIMPFLYAYAGDQEHYTLLKAGVDPATIFPRHTIYPLLAQQQVATYAFAHHSYARSPYNNVMEGAATHRVAYESLDQALAMLRQAIEAQKGRAYYYLHWGMVDVQAHANGPFAPQTLSELRAALQLIESELVAPLASGDGCLLLIGADHGQDTIDPARTVYLDHLLPDIGRAFRRTVMGRPIVPGGSAKSFFLYIREDALQETEALLRQKLSGVAEVWRVAELVERGYFGQPVTEPFLSRAGNLVIVPHMGQAVWWDEKGRYTMPFRGHHGGLSTNEMLVPLLSLHLGG